MAQVALGGFSFRGRLDVATKYTDSDSPHQWTFEGTNDESQADWTLLHSTSGVTHWSLYRAADRARTYHLTRGLEASYKYYRWTFDASAILLGRPIVVISEIELLKRTVAARPHTRRAPTHRAPPTRGALLIWCSMIGYRSPTTSG